MKINKKIIILILSCIFLVIASVGIVYAWLFNEEHTNEIDAQTSGIKFIYKINDDTKLTSSEYTITNLTFFDIDDLNEINMFLDMACMVELDIWNTGDLDITYSVNQTSGKPTVANTSGVLCLFSDTILTDADIPNTYATIEEMINDINSPVSEVINGNLPEYGTMNGSVESFKNKVYVYIIGVQTDDSANNDFLSDTYTFNLSIETTN